MSLYLIGQLYEFYFAFQDKGMHLEWDRAIALESYEAVRLTLSVKHRAVVTVSRTISLREYESAQFDSLQMHLDSMYKQLMRYGTHER